jgi:tetraacyldisaccharide 4'-kinase
LPSICVGNLALGGRGKTPLTAALARRARQDGWSPGILTRGYPVVSRRDEPIVIAPGPEREGAVWLASVRVGAISRPAWELAGRVGDEAPWLTVEAGCPVGVHPDRLLGARALLAAHPRIDLLLLDDGLQSPVRASLDVVLIDPARDLTGRAALREAPSSLDADAVSVQLGRDVHKRVRDLMDLRTGALVAPCDEPLTLAAAVADPDSVASLASALGLRVERRIRLRDHRGPGRVRLAATPGPILVTEKDAVGWAWVAGREGRVLGMELTGVEAVYQTLRARLAEGPWG